MFGRQLGRREAALGSRGMRGASSALVEGKGKRGITTLNTPSVLVHASSSPDILAPPGDVDYLISSPFKPFIGRQSSLMSPANRRIINTPGAGKRKRSRISLSPAKSAHSVRFNDILLPGSPTRKSNGRQRSLSPDKAAEAEGNVSPWRIRVTLEATQDEQDNQSSPSRKRSRPSTTTMMIPLKDDSEQTPRRPRGRPRKSGALDATPRSGGPGNTPGPGGNSEQKRRRGRPRKHQPDSAPTGTELERRSWSPLNLTGDADSDDGFYDNEGQDIPFEVPDQMDLPEPDLADENRNARPTFEPNYSTPNGDAIDRFNSQQAHDDLHSTPSKMPSPTRDLEAPSPENSMHAGHTPMPPRMYPAPSSPSLVDDERQVHNQSAREISAIASKPTIRANDPTNEHREFDSIMESEGFSMVSLNTLPSVRQDALTSNSKLAKGSLKPFLERETNGVIKRKSQVLEHSPEQDFAPNPSPNPMPSPAKALVEFPLPRASSHSSTTRLALSSPFPTKSTSIPQRQSCLRLAKLVRAGITLERVLSRSNPANSPGMAVPDFMEPRQRLEVTFCGLNPDSQRLLRAALGLGQVLAIRRRMAELRSPQRKALIEEYSEMEEELDSPHLEHTTQYVSRTPNRQYDGAVDSSPSTEMKRRFAEWQRERDAISRTIQMANSSQVIVIGSDASTSPISERLDNADADQSLWIRQAEEEQQEQQQQEEEEEVEEEMEEEEVEEEEVEEEVEEDGIDQEGRDYSVDADDDDGYEDIWQEQAQDEGTPNRGSMLEPQDDVQSSPWKGGSTPADREYGRTFSPTYWVDGQGKVPFLGQSRVRELREQEVDISTLLRAEDTPKRARYYYGKSSPLSSTQGRSPQRIPLSEASQHQRDADEHNAEPDEPDALGVEPQEPDGYYYGKSSPLDTAQERPPRHIPSSMASQRLNDTERYDVEPDEPEEPEEPEDYLDFSPERDLEDETFQIDPTTRHESEMQRHHSEIANNASVSDSEGEEHPSVHEQTLTPRNAEPANKHVPASSWFQKITSITPGWLKAPNRESSPLHKRSSPPRSRSTSKVSSPSEEQLEEEERPDEQSQEKDGGESEEPPLNTESELVGQQKPPLQPQVKSTRTSTTPKPEEAKQKQQTLSTSGYFTNAHYSLLRRLYRLAKGSPESFSYHPNSAHADIIGDYIWTSDNVYGVPITELQFAIVHRFRQELAAEDLKSGGSGWVGWTDADLHRRLVSVIIGEQIRKDRKDQLGARPSRSRPRSIIQKG
ncbi:hypothetical protein BDW59DRAFT_168272 [Aspergillus cavernicola]|uniref:AT DNA binding protein n=1 Tax=Aspergillus cavernicola TaxID=176166 RepID=A0ABR4J5V0_9EURO